MRGFFRFAQNANSKAETSGGFASLRSVVKGEGGDSSASLRMTANLWVDGYVGG